MALGVGKAAGWVGRKSTRALIGAGIGGAAAAGAVSGFNDESGPWPGVQEHVFGDPRAVQTAMGASISQAAAAKRDIQGPGDYYYGQPVSVSRMANAPTGDSVFGMYNLRRG